ncbi:MAG: CsgG/HfaB family protein [Elusimicrobiales bacterium]|jgi:TolB-like protein
MINPRTLLLFGTLTAGAIWAGWEGYHFVSKNLTATAVKTSRRRIAVMPFSSETGKKTRSSAIVTERLTSEIASDPGVEVIERSRLDQILSEQNIQSQGAIDPVTVRKIGNILGAEALVTGSVIELDDKSVEINARLVDTQNGRILKAVNKKLDRDWQDERAASWGDFDINLKMDVDLDAPEPLLPVGFMDSACARLSQDEIGAAHMGAELQARKVAHELKIGKLTLGDLTKNPGSELKDPELKRFYYAKIKDWYYKDAEAMALTDGEEETMERLRPMVAKYPCR